MYFAPCSDDLLLFTVDLPAALSSRRRLTQHSTRARAQKIGHVVVFCSSKLSALCDAPQNSADEASAGGDCGRVVRGRRERRARRRRRTRRSRRTSRSRSRSTT